jgi:hypothetical protein
MQMAAHHRFPVMGVPQRFAYRGHASVANESQVKRHDRHSAIRELPGGGDTVAELVIPVSVDRDGMHELAKAVTRLVNESDDIIRLGPSSNCPNSGRA